MAVAKRSAPAPQQRAPARRRAAKTAAKTETKAAAKTQLPAFRAVQLATLVDAVPEGEAWLHEIKFDGYRVLLAASADSAIAYTRSGLDWSDKFPKIVEAAAALELRSALIDGEAVVLDEKGRSSFQLMQGAWKNARARVVFYAFDLLELDGEDLTRLPLLERKNKLAKLIGKRQSGVLRYSDHIVGEGDKLFAEACATGLEGIIAKRANGRYVGARSESWLKIKCLQRQEFVIAGWTTSDKDRGFRSLIVAVHDDGKLKYAGKVGTGFDMAEIARLTALMQPLARSAPTVAAPRAAVRGANWIEPKLVAEVAFTEMTTDGILRHPSYVGLREDKPAKAVKLERAKPLQKTKRKKG
ncbi:non-homologous end-joining DNA ligase [Terricaulis sp.]|uniref:non-homologous end-joining DNA ligase n=1 Tax=Terricaulis sp. TaxID=2768686 RepID=UPI002AC4171D|nr:non-homologous end-joining DNA ligase [Terricaulis sp.]MDZ4690243.1 non-homologous end-joining DNA ligase [Terricaulis sp.]